MIETERMRDEYRERLKRIIGKKFDTTMIFPLSQFESAFGVLWGQDKQKTDLTKEEMEMRVKWEKCRNAILNLGNAQKRNSMTEIDLHEITQKKFKAVFLPIDKYDQRFDKLDNDEDNGSN